MDKKENNKVCPICLDNIDNNKLYITTPCNHKYCIDCFLDLYDTRCPMCRKELKDIIPSKLLSIFLKNSGKSGLIRSVNIFNELDFPPLSDS